MPGLIDNANGLDETAQPVAAMEGPTEFNRIKDHLLEKEVNRKLSVGEWVSKKPGMKNAKVSSGLKYAPKRTRLSRMLHKPKKYAIRVDKAVENIAYRSQKDFALLRETLVNHFPGALVPTIPKVKTKSAMGLFFDYILANPFFRNDAAMDIFIDPTKKNFAQDLRKHQKNSAFQGEGAIRWKEAMQSFENRFSENFQENQEFFASFKAELKNIQKHLKYLHQNIKNQMNLQEAQALSSSELATILQSMMALESNITKLAPNARFKDVDNHTHSLTTATGFLARSIFKQTTLFQKQYGSPILQKRLLDPVEHQIELITLWLKHVSTVEQKLKNLHSVLSKLQNNGEVQVDNQDLNAKIASIRKNLLPYGHGLFGIELDMYRLYRASRLKHILDQFSDFHLLGAEELMRIWDKERVHVVNLEDDDFKDSNFHKSKAYRKTCNKIADNLLSGDDFAPVVLQVCVPAQAGKLPKKVSRSKLLKIKMDEFLVGHKVPNIPNVWLAINSTGQKGYVLDLAVKTVEDTEILPVSPEVMPSTQEVVEDVTSVNSKQGVDEDKDILQTGIVEVPDDKVEDDNISLHSFAEETIARESEDEDNISLVGEADHSKIDVESEIKLTKEKETTVERLNGINFIAEKNVANFNTTSRALSDDENVAEENTLVESEEIHVAPIPVEKQVRKDTSMSMVAGETTVSTLSSKAKSLKKPPQRNFYNFLGGMLGNIKFPSFSPVYVSNPEPKRIESLPVVEEHQTIQTEEKDKLELKSAEKNPKVSSSVANRPKLPFLTDIGTNNNLKPATKVERKALGTPANAFSTELKSAIQNQKNVLGRVDVSKFQKPAPTKQMPVGINLLVELKAKLAQIHEDVKDDDESELGE